MARLTKKNEALLNAVKRQANKDAKNASAVGLGVDLVDIDRMEKALERTPRIAERVFTSGEREYAWSKARPAIHYAAFFAAREAVLKALGTGFAGVEFTDVEVVHDDRGKPGVVLHGNAQEIALSQDVIEIQISISHTHQMAVASAVAIKTFSSPPKNVVVDPMEELTRKFKEMRSLIDDIGAGDLLMEALKEDEDAQTDVLEQDEKAQDALQADDLDQAEAHEQPEEGVEVSALETQDEDAEEAE